MHVAATLEGPVGLMKETVEASAPEPTVLEELAAALGSADGALE